VRELEARVKEQAKPWLAFARLVAANDVKYNTGVSATLFEDKIAPVLEAAYPRNKLRKPSGYAHKMPYDPCDYGMFYVFLPFFISLQGQRLSPGPVLTLDRIGVWLLTYIYRSLPLSRIAQLAGRKTKFVRQKVMWAAGVLEDAAKRAIQLPSVAQIMADTPAKLSERYPNVAFLAVDATPVPIYRPSSFNDMRNFYSPKAKCTCLKVFILCTPNGRIVYLSPAYPGCTNDKTIYVKSRVNEMLDDEYLDVARRTINGTPYEMNIMGDKGYVGCPSPACARFRLTKSAKNGRDVDDVDNDTMGGDENDSMGGDENSNGDDNARTAGICCGAATSANTSILDVNICKHRWIVETAFGWMKSFKRLNNGEISLTNAIGAWRMVAIAAWIVNLRLDDRIGATPVPFEE
jgi:hypothetical protein